MKTLFNIILSILLVPISLAQLPTINIWKGTSVKKAAYLTPFLANGNNNPCIIICPGGSYFWHDKYNEGISVAKWLQSKGISSFILHYRTANFADYLLHARLFYRGTQYPDSQNDLQRAISIVKDSANNYSIDTMNVGVMGFSAGGHLVMSVAEHNSARTRPAFVAAIYPVVSFTSEYTHKKSMRGLLGEYRKKDILDSASIEKHIPENCPPVFLVNCVDDPVVDYHNSILLDSALTNKGINHKYIQYKTGGHGFGASNEKGSPECRGWKDEFIKWLLEL